MEVVYLLKPIRLLAGLGMLVLILGVFPIQAHAETTSSIVEYALKWNEDPGIPYIFGGERTTSLEDISKDPNKGTDCSGFVSLVYKHFDIQIPAQSDSMLAVAKKEVSESEALPGDVCWWKGHVGLYIGDGKMIHTNTATAPPPGNLPHVSEFGVNYGKPAKYLRMVDDTSLLGKLKDEVKDEVSEAVPKGVLRTESDLTGMPIPSTLTDNQEDITLMSLDDMSQGEQERVASIQENIDLNKTTVGQALHSASAFIGICVLMYGILLLLFVIFDRVNTVLDFSLVTVATLGKLRVVSEEDVKAGASLERQKHGVTNVTLTGLLKRILIMLIIGFFCVNGCIINFILSKLVPIFMP